MSEVEKLDIVGVMNQIYLHFKPEDVEGQALKFVLASDYDALAAQLKTETLRADAAVGDANEAESAGKAVSLLLAERITQRDEGLAREAELRLKVESKDRLIEQGFKTLDRVHCMWAKRLLDATGIPSQVLIPDEEFVKYFEELKGLKQRLAKAEKLANLLLDEYDNSHRDGRPFRAGPLLEEAHSVLASPGCADGGRP